MKTASRMIVSQLALALLIAVGGASAAWAQGEIASGTISGGGSGPSYDYSLSFSNGAGATSPIGSVWYAWVPGQFFLPTTPTSASAPTGWAATISGNSIQFVANSSADYIAAGQTLSGFGYQATFSPAQLTAALNSGESVAYSAGLFSDSGDTFTVQMVPEPSTVSLLVIGGLGLASFWRWNVRRMDSKPGPGTR